MARTTHHFACNMDRYQNIGAVAEAAYAEMERPDRFADLSDAAGDEQDQTATTSVEELLDILAELSERVTRLERAMVMLLANENRPEAPDPVDTPDMDAYVVDESELEPEPEPVPPPRSYRPAPQPTAKGAASLTDTLSVAIDLPSHQWGAEGLTEQARNSGPITPIRHSDYPEIKAPEEENPAPVRRRTGAPERVVVRAALESYPHIVESVCLMWGGREADDYLSRLVIDTRGGRRGFPREVMDELLVLAEVCTIKSGLKPDFTPFDRDRSRERER